MDEVHNLIVTDIENKPESNYFVILDWLDKINKKRVLVLTATPMRQEVDEIAPILNLVLPPTKRFEIGKAFKNKYFNVVSKKDKSVDELQWRKDMKDEFQEKIKGYVSVVKQRRDVKVEYIGNILKPIQYYRLYAHTMDEFQSKTYLSALTKDETEKKKKGGAKSSSFYSNAQQASLFVFPDGQYGEKANEKFITNSTFSIMDPNTKKETNILVNKLDPEFMKLSKCKYGDENIFDFIAKQFEILNDQSAEKFYMTVAFGQLLHKVNSPSKFKKGIDLIVKFRETIPQEYRSQSDPYFNTKVLAEILKAKKGKGQQDLVDIVTAVIPKM
jgi:hypothetical protein